MATDVTVMTLGQQVAQKLKDARSRQEELIKALAQQQARVTRLENILQTMTQEREHFVNQLIDAGVLSEDRFPF